MAYVIDGNKKYIPPKSTKVNFNENIFYDYEWDKTRVPKVDLLDELGYKQYEFNVNGKDLGSVISKYRSNFVDNINKYIKKIRGLINERYR